MGAHDAENLIIDISKFLKQASRKPALPILAVDDELGYPANLSALVVPAAGKYIAGKSLIDMNTDVGPASARR